MHAELGHAPGFNRQRHWLRERIAEDCRRCGWHGYFHRWIATIGADWAAAVCDDCYAGLHPLITVTVKFCSACWPGTGESVAVIVRGPAATTRSPTWARRWPGGCGGSTLPCLSTAGAVAASRAAPRSAAAAPGRSPPGWRPAAGQLMRPGCPGSPRPIRGETWLWTRRIAKTGRAAVRPLVCQGRPVPGSRHQRPGERRGVPPPG